MNKKLKQKLEARRKQLKSGGGNKDYFVFKDEGTVRMRPLPTPSDDIDWAVEVEFIYLGLKERKALISPATFGGKCAFAEKYKKLMASKKDSDKKLAEKIQARRKYMVAHLKYNDLKGKELDTQMGPKLVLLHKGQYESLLDFYLEDEKGDFTDPKNGYDIKYSRSGKTRTDTEYTVLDCGKSALPKEYLKKTFDPIQMVKDIIPTYEETKEILETFLHEASQAKDVDEEEEAPSKGKGKDKKKKKKKKSDA